MREWVWIFIGYSAPDEKSINSLYDRLSAEGLRPWADVRDLLPGDEPAARQRAAISGADIFLACLSNNSVDRRGQLEPGLGRQLDLHLQQTRTRAFLIPVRLEECRLPDSLACFEPVDLFEGGGWDRLLESINAVLSRRREVETAWAALISEPDGSDVELTEEPEELLAIEDEEGALDGPADKYSVPEWELDLTRLIGGKREHSLLYLGGVEEYVSVNLEEAADPAAARQAFNQALRNLIQTWEPTMLNDGQDTSHLLDLIRLFNPSEGFVKVVEFIQRMRRFAGKGGGEELISGDEDVLRKALAALESCYRVAPPPPKDSAPAYKTYIDLLTEELRTPRRSGYALKRLIELQVIELKSDKIKELIEKNHAVLRELVNLLLDPNRSSEVEDELARILTYCLDIGREAVWEFEESVAQCGGEIEFSDNEERPLHIVYGGEVFGLKLSEEMLYKYQDARWKRTDQAGFSRIDELANAPQG